MTAFCSRLQRSPPLPMSSGVDIGLGIDESPNDLKVTAPRSRLQRVPVTGGGLFSGEMGRARLMAFDIV